MLFEGATSADRTPIGFPATHWSMVGAVADPVHPGWRSAIEELARLYWRPAYHYLRLRWGKSHEEAKDLCQDFFEGILEGKNLPREGAERARFRTFVRACIDNLVRDQHRGAQRIKRGGGKALLSLDIEEGEATEIATTGGSPDEVLDQQWRMAVVRESVERLRKFYEKEGRAVVFEVYQRHDLADDPSGPPPYNALATEFGLPEGTIENYLKQARQRLLGIARELVMQTVADQGSLDEEMKALFLLNR